MFTSAVNVRKLAGTLAFARALSAELRRHCWTISPEEIREWPVARVHDTVLWLDLQARGGEYRGLGEFRDARQSLPRCRACGRPEVDGVAWASLDLCRDCDGSRPC